MTRAKEATLILLMGILILGGAAGLYLFTVPQQSTNSLTTGSTIVGSSASTSAASSSQSVTTTVQNGGGYQVNGQPAGAWADYLGYIPNGYSLAPHLPNAATYTCPSGMSSTQCATFKQSCGNGVCDPNESCATCPIDCGVSGQLTCDPYTGRPGAPISICQLGGAG